MVGFVVVASSVSLALETPPPAAWSWEGPIMSATVDHNTASRKTGAYGELVVATSVQTLPHLSCSGEEYTIYVQRHGKVTEAFGGTMPPNTPRLCRQIIHTTSAEELKIRG